MITGCLLFLLMLPQGLSEPAESLPSLKVEVRMVEIYAAVLNGKKYVPGLQQDQFQVLENGRPQKIAAFEAQSTPLTMALLMDTTGSMQKALPFVKNAVMQLLTNMRPEDQVGLFSFTDQLQVLQPFGKEKSLELHSIQRKELPKFCAAGRLSSREPANVNTPNHTVSAMLPPAAGQQVTIPNISTYLRNNNPAGTIPAGSTYAGPL